jgi:phosphoadenosine phosphosulfate reductase
MMSDKLDVSVDLLRRVGADYGGDAVFACSFGAEDVVLLDLISLHARNIGVITLDTGRLHQATYDVMDACRKRFGIEIRVYFPDAAEVESMVREKGLNLFYDSVANRKLCCEIRKIHPLRRALSGKRAWLTGLRREQADSRESMKMEEDDVHFDIKKFNPLLEWTEDEVWAYIREQDLPYNALHDRHFPSIGCEPCTRAIAAGEDARAGRWWWEQDDGVAECGLHADPLKRKGS